MGSFLEETSYPSISSFIVKYNYYLISETIQLGIRKSFKITLDNFKIGFDLSNQDALINSPKCGSKFVILPIKYTKENFDKY